MGRLQLVPWFSKEEWRETYKAAFSNDICRWKEAKDTMLMWQARVEKLPAGIDVTLPLLHAKIVEADPGVDNAVKSIFLASALQRFVTSIVKLPQSKYYKAQPMHCLATEIGLPMHLVDLRNEIVHGHGGWGGGEAVFKALEVAYKWIKEHYWDTEFEKTQTNSSMVSECTPEDWEAFIHLLRTYTRFTKTIKKKINGSTFNEVRKNVLERLESLYSLKPEECTKAVVSHVLLPEVSCSLASHIVKGDVCECGCCIEPNVLQKFKPLLDFFLETGEDIELLLSCLIRRGQEHSELSSEWICIISGALLDMPCFSSQESHCENHSITLMNSPSEEVEWKRVVVELLTPQSEWCTDIAMRIMDSPQSSITDSQKDKLRDFLSHFNECSKASSAKEMRNSTPMDQELYTVNNILSAAKLLPLGERRKLERLKISVLGGTDADEVSVSAPVGVLPHQNDYSLFYKELILHYPDSDTLPPPCKKQKRQESHS